MVYPLADYDRDKMFVWPWIGIVANIPTDFEEGRHSYIPTEFKDGRYVGDSGTKLRDQLTRRWFTLLECNLSGISRDIQELLL